MHQAAINISWEIRFIRHWHYIGCISRTIGVSAGMTAITMTCAKLELLSLGIEGLALLLQPQ